MARIPSAIFDSCNRTPVPPPALFSLIFFRVSKIFGTKIKSNKVVVMMKQNELTTQVKILGCFTVMNATGAPRITACSMDTRDMNTNFDSEYSSDILLALYACMFATTSVQQFKTPKRTIGMSLAPPIYLGSHIPKLLVRLV